MLSFHFVPYSHRKNVIFTYFTQPKTNIQNGLRAHQTGELPRTWSDILGGFGCGEIKRFPLEGQALTNARHAIPRMGRKGLKFRTRSKGDHFYILCTAHQQDGARLSRKEIQQLFRSLELGE